MESFINSEFGTFTKIDEKGVYAKRGNGEEHLIFSLDLQNEPKKTERPTITSLEMTPTKLVIFWGEAGKAPSVTFERA